MAVAVSDAPDADAQMQLRNADHDAEVVALHNALMLVCERYWFVGKAELVGTLARVSFRLQAHWLEQDRAQAEAEDGSD